MFVFSDRSKASIEKSTGISFEKLSRMPMEEIEKIIQEKKGKRLSPRAKTDHRYFGRGTVYLFHNRIDEMKDLDERLAKI